MQRGTTGDSDDTENLQKISDLFVEAGYYRARI